MDAPNPTRQMTLIREACFYGNFRETEPSFSNHFNRPLQPKMGNVAVWADTNRSSEDARKMELTPVCHFREGCDIEGFVQMRANEILQPLEHVLI
jgi:hypothetical protein